MSVIDRQKGCFFGLAIGDALGMPIEAKKPGFFEPVTFYRNSGHLVTDTRRLKAGEWTDDTSMALALADALSSNPSDFPRVSLENYLKWYRKGKYTIWNKCCGMGGNTRRALEEFESNGNVFATNKEIVTNGSIMRLAPIPIKFYNHNPKSIAILARMSSMTTHNSKVCMDACAYLSLIISNCIIGRFSKEEILSRSFPGKQSLSRSSYDGISPEISLIINGSFKTDIVHGSFLAAGTLEAALWAFWSSKSFEETVLKAVNLGGDADTVGAVAGQIAGAYYGFSSIPNKYIKGLVKRRLIQKYFYKLLLGNNNECYN